MNFLLLLLFSTCLTCHKGIENISSSHQFSCATCHNGDSTSNKLPDAHQGLIRNPSAPSHLEEKCGRCHEKEIKNLRNSLHSTAAGEINITRFLFGAQKSPYGHYATISTGDFIQIPQPLSHPDLPREIVDDLLRRKCLRCHVNTEGVRAPGFYRASGCAACHVVYENNGKYRGNDKSVRGKVGYPAFHRFVKKIPDIQCLHCHNGNRVGADYYGLFEHDYNLDYRSPVTFDSGGKQGINSIFSGERMPVYGIDFHHLQKDIHKKLGLQCIDCHEKNDLMGDGRLHVIEIKAVKVKCESCHGGFDTKPDPEFVTKRNGKYQFTAKTGKIYEISIFQTGIVGHDKNHKRVACSLCHTSWAYGDYGFHVVRIDIKNYYPWRKFVLQAYPIVTRFLKKELGKPFKDWDKPEMKDFINGKEKLGLWLSGWTTRRWEFVPMGVAPDGRYVAFRPMFQFFVSYVDSEGYVILDSKKPVRGDGKVWGSMPYIPHTTMREGRSCSGCHGNTEALGLGYRLMVDDSPGPVVDSIMIMPPSVLPDARLLNSLEIKKLLKPKSNIIFKK